MRCALNSKEIFQYDLFNHLWINLDEALVLIPDYMYIVQKFHSLSIAFYAKNMWS